MCNSLVRCTMLTNLEFDVSSNELGSETARDLDLLLSNFHHLKALNLNLRYHLSHQSSDNSLGNVQ
jgi:hypothetical protein